MGLLEPEQRNSQNEADISIYPINKFSPFPCNAKDARIREGNIDRVLKEEEVEPA